jgi:hypothetical protein
MCFKIQMKLLINESWIVLAVVTKEFGIKMRPALSSEQSNKLFSWTRNQNYIVLDKEN